MKSTSRYVLLAVVLAILMAAALAVDERVATWVYQMNQRTGFKDHYYWPLWVVRRPGNFWFALAVAVPLGIWHAWRWRAAVMLLLCGMAAGIAGWAVKWLVGRHRPFKGYGTFELHPCTGGFHGLIKTEAALSFPSGDVCFAAATAMCLSFMFPRWTWAFFTWVVLVAVQRILVDAHYPSDTVGAIGLGIVCAAIVWRSIPSLRRPDEKGPGFEPIMTKSKS